MALGPDVRPGDAEVLERHGFKMDTAYMELPQCDTCKWWERLDRSVGRCGFAGTTGAERPMVLITGDERMLTSPDFGCVQWEGKDHD